MKNIVFLLLVLSGSFSLAAQDDHSHRDRIRALKTAYITEGLNLTVQEAQQFWPIYNAYTEKRREIYKKEREDIGRMECISEAQANEMLHKYEQLENQDYLLKKKFHSELKDIFPAKKIILLKKVEREFNHKMIREYRERHSKPPKNNS